MKASQRAAAEYREAWKEAGGKERARRAEREGGAEGKRWRGVGWQAWLQSHRAIREEEEDTKGGNATGTGEKKKETGQHTGGLGIIAALIFYQQHKKEQARRREANRRGEGEEQETKEDTQGRDVVVFDVETTHLIEEEETAIEDMEVSIACAVRIPIAKSIREAVAQEEHGTFWHKDACDGRGEREGIEGLLEWFDTARTIVAYNGRHFDMRALRGLYGPGEEGEKRWQAHVAKLHDPFAAVQRAAGRRTGLATLLSLNGRKGKAGAGCDAPALWRDGKLNQLEMYCRRDVEALRAQGNSAAKGNKGTRRWVDDSSVSTGNNHSGSKERRRDTNRGDHGREGKRRRNRQGKEGKERGRQRTGRYRSRARQQRRHTTADGRK